VSNERRTPGFRASRRASPQPAVPPDRPSLRRQPAGSQLQLLGSIPLHDLRPTHVPRGASRHRSLPACSRRSALSSGHPRARVPKTLADANERRDWRIYADFAQKVIAEGRRLYTDEPLGLDLDQSVYALDSTTIDLCLSLFPWARFSRDRNAVKLHTLLDLRGSIPANLWVTRASFNDNRILDVLLPEPGRFPLSAFRFPLSAFRFPLSGSRLSGFPPTSSDTSARFPPPGASSAARARRWPCNRCSWVR
jgi:hypothetical protein